MAEHIKDPFIVDGPSEKDKLERAAVLKHDIFKEGTYTIDDSWMPARNVNEIHSTQELIEFAKKGEIEIEARALAVKEGSRGYKKLDTKQFIEACEGKQPAGKLNFKEAVDAFLQYDDYGAGLVGDDFTPLLGGPFYKQLYIHDYLRMHSVSFYAYNHDPYARAIAQITRDFTLGRGWRADSKNKEALALWNAFEEANDLLNMMDSFAIELSVYGESMVWWLPNNATKIAYNLSKGQKVPHGLLPRVRLIDPSCIWEIVTYPEDITRVLYYQWVAPTQYQIYANRDQKTGDRVPSSKFIFQQIPADEVMHFKVNSVSNEKRGRSDFFPVLGYLKRLRDSVNYGIISMQKNMAWSIDTTIDGSPQDIDNYMRSQAELGTIPPAGSEFIHSKKVERKYLSNEGGRGQQTSIFEWCLSSIAAGSGIPINYFGTHLNGGSTRASALVATEPVTKKFEKRRAVYENVLKQMSRRLLRMYGIEGEIEFTFPELVSQDRSTKFKDMALAEMQGWISKERIAPIAAKELDITDYSIEKDLGTPKENPASLSPSPLTDEPKTETKPSAVTSDERKRIDNNG